MIDSGLARAKRGRLYRMVNGALEEARAEALQLHGRVVASPIAGAIQRNRAVNDRQTDVHCR